MNEMMYNNFNNGLASPYGMMQYATNYQRPLMTQPLTKEEISLLQDKGGAFSTKVTQEDMLKSYCTHKNNGTVVAYQNPDGSFTCPICGETFEMLDLTKESVEADVKKVIDDMQNIKLTYLDISSEVARQYFPLIPLLQKLPKLAVMAAANFAKYENNGNAFTNGTSPYGFAAYNQLVMGAPMGGYGAAPMMGGFYQQPMMGQQMMNQPMANGYDPNAMVNPMNPQGAYPMYQQPNMMGQMPQQPMMNPPMYQQPNMMGNPIAGNEFGTYGNPAYAAQQTPVQVSQPQVPNQPAQTAAPAPGTPQVDTQSFKI